MSVISFIDMIFSAIAAGANPTFRPRDWPVSHDNRAVLVVLIADYC
jgi:hypothetical protein